MSDVEYRVSWKRIGLRRKSRQFATLRAAEKHAEMLRTGDPHWRCDEGHGYYTSDGPDREFQWTCMEVIEEGPVIEERQRLPWTPTHPAIEDEETPR